ncbi:MAG: ATP-binding protein [Lentisphaeria bacterium]|nr:ATP-binding protein [Lentisphaeria bacterium]
MSLLGGLAALLALAVVLSGAASNAVAAEAATVPARILLLSPYNISFAQHHEMMAGFTEHLRSSGESYWLNPFEFDGVNQMTSQDIEAGFKLMRPDIEQGRYDVIVTFGEPALDLLGTLGEALPKTTAVVFCGQDEFDRRHFPEGWAITGVLVDQDPGPGIDLIRRLLPARRQLVLLANWTRAGEALKEKAAVCLRRDPGMELVTIDNASVSTEEMLARIGALDDDAVILLQGWYNRQAVNTASLQQLLRALGGHPAVPVFVMHEVMLDYGIVGGVVERGRETGRQAAETALAILRGQAARDIPVRRIRPTVMLNWAMLDYYGIDARLAPESAILRGAPVTFWTEHRGWFIGGAVYGLVLLGLAVALAVLIIRCRRYGKRMRAVFQHLPVHVGAADALGRIHLYLPGRDPSLAAVARPAAITNLPVDLAAVIRAELPGVLTTGQAVVREYVLNGLHCQLEMVRLPDDIFGRQMALWVSGDVEELSSNRVLLQNYVDQLAVQKAALEKQKEEDQLILDNLDIPAGLYGADGKLLRINAPLCAIVGRSEEEILANPGSDLFSDVLPEGARPLLERVLAAREPVHQDIHLGGRDVVVSAVPVCDAGGKVIKVVKTAVDVTDVNQMAASERVLNRCLESLLLTEDVGTAVMTVLQAIQRHFSADNCFVITYDLVSKIMACPYEVHADGLKPLAAAPTPVPLPEAAPWLDALKERQMLCCEDLAASGAPADEVVGLGLVPGEGARSRYRVGVYYEGQLWGELNLVYRQEAISLDSHRQTLLRALAHLLEIVLERQQSRLRLEAAEREKRLLLDAVPIPILLYRTDGALLRCNNAAIAMAGHSEEEILREPFACNRFFCHGADRTADCPVMRTSVDCLPHTQAVRLGDREYLFQSHPILSSGRLAYILKTMIDVTEVNSARRAAEAALVQARQAEAAKGRFLATMSHELRTPLNAIIGFSELLEGLKVTHQEEREYVNSIHLAGKALLELINDVLDLSKMEAGQMPIIPQPTSLPVLFDELGAVFRPGATSKGLSLEFQAASDIPVLSLDRLRVRQILYNLIGNALKYTPSGGITVKAAYSGQELVLQVCDTGIGIAPQHQQSIFEPFVQQDAVRDAGLLRGTGLGLSISRHLAEKMGGGLGLDSEPGKGSVFTCRLPGVAPAATDVCAADNGKTAAPARPEARILVVDDVVLNLNMLSAMLSRLGYDVVSAQSSQEALAQLQPGPFDLVLTDMWMPDMNGRELARRIRAVVPGIRIVVVTGDSELAAAGADTGGFDDVLLKPVTLKSLQKTLNRVLAR